MEDLDRLDVIKDAAKREKVKEFMATFIVEDETVQRIMDTFEDQIRLANSPDEKLRKQTDLFWENTYVRHLLEGNETGTYLGLDLGGTNFRIVRVDIANGKANTDTKYYNLDNGILTGSSDLVFDYIAKCLQSFLVEENLTAEHGLSLGFTFSFPSTQESLKVSILQTWTKNIKCTDGVGRDPIVMLEEAIKRQGGLSAPVELVGRISDTTGTLMAGNFADKQCRIGLILGTGSNAAFFEYTKNIEKWDSFYKDDDDSELVAINSEFGAFGDNGCLDFIKNEYVREVDEHSNHPGSFTFEKHFSGLYLGELTRLVLAKLTKLGLLFSGKGSEKLFTRSFLTTRHVTAVESDKDTDVTHTMKVLKELELDQLATEDDVSIVREVCYLVSKRGAVIVSSAMVVMLHHINLPEVTIAIDGSLYEHHPKYHDHIAKHVAKWAPKTKTKLILVKDGSGQGGAFVAAAEMRRRASENHMIVKQTKRK